MNKYKLYAWEIFLLTIAILTVLISFIYDNDEKLWFMRSGSIMVLLAVIVEYKLNQKALKNINRKSKMSAVSGFPVNLLNSKEHNRIAIFTHTFAILGTLIWGYGDLIRIKF